MTSQRKRSVGEIIHRGQFGFGMERSDKGTGVFLIVGSSPN